MEVPSCSSISHEMKMITILQCGVVSHLPTGDAETYLVSCQTESDTLNWSLEAAKAQSILLLCIWG